MEESFNPSGNFVVDWSTPLHHYGVHRSVSYEVVNFGRRCFDPNSEFDRQFFDENDQLGIWNYYVKVHSLGLNPEQFDEFWLTPKRYYGDRPIYDYDSPRWSRDCEWHGGVTFYEKNFYVDVKDQTGADARVVKIGCDYNHLWDRECGANRWLTKEIVAADAMRTIDCLCDIYDFYVRCSWNGSWVPSVDAIHVDGRNYSKSGYEGWMKCRSERNEKKSAEIIG